MRTPLSAIRGYTELLAATEHFSDDGRRAVDRVLEQSSRMSAWWSSCCCWPGWRRKPPTSSPGRTWWTWPGKSPTTSRSPPRITGGRSSPPRTRWRSIATPRRCAGSSPTCWAMHASTPAWATP
ncbi:histidine kinase dimerization/phospho-acceptor domain-containing protein [Arthrobacter sp. JCM 19049]|uniref:histidine kinase dimerization/phospho-acceptor domain-containing protein n=1 Tax=Arthrobacter sp. JCM 19049 TaxID=1460643 RepID=UPI00243652F0|nr:histidine kinase dimerization/phospho-acceptor domain-containing protein [Arthrobacter sp. JCM 19049]